MNVFELFATISLDTSNYESQLSSAREQTTGVFDKMQKAGGTLTSVGGALTSLSEPVFDLGKGMLQTASDFEAGMSEVEAISRAGGDEMTALEEKAMEMASKTKFTTAESAEAYKYMAMAGWKTNDMLNSLSAVMYLAGASGESLGQTSDIVTDAMTAFGLAADGTSRVVDTQAISSKEAAEAMKGLILNTDTVAAVLADSYTKEVDNATRFTDVLSAAATNSNTNVAMLGESFKYIGTTAGAAGYSVEDIALALGLMANSGVKAGSAGIYLKNIITNLVNPSSDKMAAAIANLGLSATDAEGNMYSFGEIIRQMREAFNGGSMSSEEFSGRMDALTASFESGELSGNEYEEALKDLAAEMYGLDQATKIADASIIAGKYGMAGMLALINAAPGDVDKLTEAIYSSNGATKEMYEIMTDNAQGAVTMLESALNVLFTTLGQKIVPIFTDVVKKITEAVNWFNGLGDGAQTAVVAVIGLVSAFFAIGKVITVIGGVVSAVGTIGSAVSGAGSAVSALGGVFGSVFAATGPVGIVIAVIGAVVAALVVLWNTNEDFRNAVKDIWESIKGFFSDAAENIQKAWEGISGFFKGVWDGIQETFSNVKEWFGEKFRSAKDAATAAWNDAKDKFSAIRDGIQDAFSGVKDWFKETFRSAKDKAVSAWNDAKDKFSAKWNGIKEAFHDVKGWFGDRFREGKEKAVSAWSDAKSKFSTVWGSIKEAFGNIRDWFKEKFRAAKDAAVSVWDGIKEKFKSIGGNVLTGLWNGISDKVGWLKTQVSGVVDKIKSWFTGKSGFDSHSPSRWSKGVGSFVMQGLSGGIDSGVPELKRSVGKAVSAVKDGLGALKSAGEVDYDPNVDYSAFMEKAQSYEELMELAAKRTAKAAGEGIDTAANGWRENAELIEQWREKFGRTVEDAGQAFARFAGSVSKAAENLISEMPGFGSRIIAGLADGALKSQTRLDETMKEIAENVKNRFAGIGENMALGIGEGWDSRFGEARKSMEAALKLDAGAAEAGVSGAPRLSGYAGQSQTQGTELNKPVTIVTQVVVEGRVIGEIVRKYLIGYEKAYGV